MGEPNTDHGVYECQHCGNVPFGNPSSGSNDEELTSIERTPVKHPELPVVLREVFGISETGINICVCLMEEGASTAGNLAERLDMDRSTVGRQLNHLTDIGLLEKRQRLLKDGGYVYVYSPVDVEEIRQRLTVGLCTWVGETLELVEDINREKLKAMARADGSGDGGTAEIYWDG